MVRNYPRPKTTRVSEMVPLHDEWLTQNFALRRLVPRIRAINEKTTRIKPTQNAYCGLGSGSVG
jgi:hypothetical protein